MLTVPLFRRTGHEATSFNTETTAKTRLEAIRCRILSFVDKETTRRIPVNSGLTHIVLTACPGDRFHRILEKNILPSDTPVAVSRENADPFLSVTANGLDSSPLAPYLESCSRTRVFHHKTVTGYVEPRRNGSSSIQRGIPR
jgi:hypothetical protein